MQKKKKNFMNVIDLTTQYFLLKYYHFIINVNLSHQEKTVNLILCF